MGHRDEGSSRHRSRSPSSTKKRHRDGKHSSSKHSSSKRRRREEEEEDVWVEKGADSIPSKDTGSLTSHAKPSRLSPELLPGNASTTTKIPRDDWMLEPETRSNIHSAPATTGSVADQLRTGGSFSVGSMPERREWGTREKEDFTEGFGEGDTAGVMGGDYFASLGSKREKKPKDDAPNPEKPAMSRYELNKQIYDASGKRKDDPAPTMAATPSTSTSGPAPGSAGWDWRMKKLKRTYEAAEEDGRPIEEIAIDRYGSLEAFEAAKEERRYIDERDARRQGKGRGVDVEGPGLDEFGREIRRAETPTPVAGRFLLNQSTNDSASSSRPGSSRGASFRRPGDRPETPSVSRPSSKPSTPVPSVFTPPASRPSGLGKIVQTGADDAPAPMSPTSLNRLQAKVLKAKLMDAPDAAELEAQYEAASRAAQAYDQPNDGATVRALPTLDGQGRLYDIGASGRKPELPPTVAGKRKKKDPYVETHDTKTGELIRRNADDDSTTLDEMVRQERFGGGAAEQKDLDAEFAARIAGDTRFDNSVDYMDENVEALARKKLRSEAQKRMFAINDYAKTQKALDTCPYCFQETAAKPRTPLVALGTRVYLGLPQNEGLVDGHCLIIPLQHHLSTLEADDDTWEEIKNFMKTLMQAFAAKERGVVFFETVISLRRQQHSVIEAIPVPWDLYEECPAYFKESIMSSESEWSQHKKLIDFSARPGGFRRALVPELPYFAVMWDYRGNKGYGHVIEGVDKGDADPDAYDIDENTRSGATEFSRTFGHETLGQMMQLEPRRWRKPRRIGAEMDAKRVADFQKSTYTAKYDWTRMLAQTSA